MVRRPGPPRRRAGLQRAVRPNACVARAGDLIWSRLNDMNRMEFPGGGGEAQIRYLDGDFKIVRPGSYVRCAISSRPILIQDLKYWSVERQEAYVDADAALEAYRRHNKL